MSELTVECNYVPDLDDASLAIAKSELNEDEKNRDGAVEVLRDWIKQQPWLDIPTGTRYLMRYLRNTKFSQLGARKKLETCWTFRTECSDWFDDRDPTDSKLEEVIKYGFVLRLPRTDSQGRTFLLVRPGSVDVEKLKKEFGGAQTIFKLFTTIMDWLSMDEKMQINGLVLIVDQSDVSLAHKAELYTVENVRRLATALQHVYPIRLKQINVYNPPLIMEAVIGIMKNFLKPKLRDRLEIHGKNLASLYKKIDKTVLPKEYLPDDCDHPNSGTIQSIIDSMVQDLSKPEFLEHLKNLSKYRVHMDKKPEDNEPAASFRKLNVD